MYVDLDSCSIIVMFVGVFISARELLAEAKKLGEATFAPLSLILGSEGCGGLLNHQSLYSYILCVL